MRVVLREVTGAEPTQSLQNKKVDDHGPIESLELLQAGLDALAGRCQCAGPG
jgi:hypothetical protein